MKKKTIIRIGMIITLVLIIFMVWINLSVGSLGNKYCYDSVDDIPHNHCAIVLGTSKFLSNGHENLYYLNRIKAAVELFNHKKIDYIIVSGDNRHMSYNEPKRMFNDLVEDGIPKNKIFLDYAGFRTLDSVIRGKEVFGQNEFTIVSQPFHNQRAVYIARKKGIKAIAFNAGDVYDSKSVRVNIREIGARILLAFDMLIKRQPHFLGEKVIIPAD